jgi:hypothetical protein
LAGIRIRIRTLIGVGFGVAVAVPVIDRVKGFDLPPTVSKRRKSNSNPKNRSV